MLSQSNGEPTRDLPLKQALLATWERKRAARSKERKVRELRVLHVVATGERRGAEVFAADLVQSLSEAGLDQGVAVLRATGSSKVAYEAPTTVLGPDGRMVRLLRLDLRRVRSLRRLVNEMEPDILQAHGGEALKYSVTATLGRRTPVIYRKIGMAASWAVHGPRRAAYALLMARATRVTAVAEAIRRETIELFGVSPHRIVVIPNGVDPQRIRPSKSRAETRRILGIPPDARVVLSVGSITWEKDPLAHLEISSRVLRSSPSAMHLFVGDGAMRRQVESAIRQQGLDRRVLLLGARDDIGDVLAAGDLLLFASRPDGMEGMPGILIEAGMAGLPVAGYAVAGVPEVVVNGTTGLLVPPGDRDALATHVLNLLLDLDANRCMGDAARAWCYPRFAIQGIASEYLALYESLGDVP